MTVENQTIKKRVNADNTTNPISFSFHVEQEADLSVYKILLSTGVPTLLTGGGVDYTAAIDDDNEGGTITPTAGIPSTYDILIINEADIIQPQDFPTEGSFNETSVEQGLDRACVINLIQQEQVNRCLKLKKEDVLNTTSYAGLFIKSETTAARQSRLLAWNSAGDEIETSLSTSGLEDVADIVDEIVAVAAIDSEIVTVAGIASAVSTVAGIASAVSTVSGISSAVSTVAGISSAVSTVSGISSNVSTVAGIASNVTTVAGISANVTTVAGISSAVSTVATNIASVNTCATNIAAIITVAGVFGDGDKGDLTISSSGTVWTIDNNVVTYAKMQDFAAGDRVLGRQATSGDPQELTIHNVLDFLSTTRGHIPYRGASSWAGLAPGTSGLPLISNGTGADPSYSALGTSAISNDAITYAKIQNVAANSFLGNNTGSSGDVAEVALSASQLAGRGSTGNLAAITLGTNLSMSGTTLNASGGGVTGILRAQKSGDQAISADTLTKVTFETEDIDSASAFASSTYTVQAGTTRVSVNWKFITSAAGDQQLFSPRIYKNGSAVDVVNYYTSGTGGQGYEITADINVTTGDTIEAYMYFGSNGRTIQANAQNTRICIMGFA